MRRPPGADALLRAAPLPGLQRLSPQARRVRLQPGLGRHFWSSIKGESQLDWDDEGARSAFLAGLVADARRAMELAGQVCQELEKGSAAVRRIEALSYSLLIGNHFIAADHGSRSRADMLKLALRRLGA